MKYIVQFQDVGKDDVGVAGGKGANLGEMTRAGLPVPPGFIVTSDAYFSFLEKSGLRNNIEQALATIDYNNSRMLEKASAAIEHLIISASMPDDIADAIKQAYLELSISADMPAPGELASKTLSGDISLDANISYLEGEGIEGVGTEEELAGSAEAGEMVTGEPFDSGGVYVAVRSSATAEDLPKASFAGQQVTFLNVKGTENVVDAVKRAWASLFEARAIFYRHDKGFDHFKVGIAIPVQKMIESEKSGIMFTVEPLTNNMDEIEIEAVFGLGEAVVSGDLTPDSYIVRKSDLNIIEKHIAEQLWKIELKDGRDQHVEVSQELRGAQKLSDDEIVALARYGLVLENHYDFPQDAEWAIEGGNIYLVQTRPVTTLSTSQEKVKIQGQAEAEERARAETEAQSAATEQVQTEIQALETAPSETHAKGEAKSSQKDAVETIAAKTVAGKPSGEVILEGIAASTGMASGSVKIISGKEELDKVMQGDVLVTPMTNPDYVPAMRRAVAIITDAGGRTSHAAIVSRELGIPSVVGTGKATELLRDGDIVTVDGARGIIYSGETQAKPLREKRVEEAARTTSSISGIPSESSVPITATKIYINLAEPELAARSAALPVDGVGLLRAEFVIAGIGTHPRTFIDEGRQQEFIDKLADGLREFAQAFYPRPVVYRTSDFKTNEYRELAGGDKYEKQENNPMIGYRGVSRYVKERDEFEMELAAIKKVRDSWGLKNLWVMLPFVRKVSEVDEIKQIMQENGLRRSTDFKLWLMIEVPSTVFLIEDFCKAGIDGVSIGSNDLTQLVLGIDRDSEVLAPEFDERDEAVMKAMFHVIRVCRRHGVTSSICGQAPSTYPEITEALVRHEITSVSVNPDAVMQTRRLIASTEQRMILEMLERLRETGRAA